MKRDDSLKGRLERVSKILEQKEIMYSELSRAVYALRRAKSNLEEEIREQERASR